MKRAALVVLVALAAVGCKATYVRRMDAFRANYAQGDFAAADAAVDQVLAKETRADPAEIARTHALSVDAGRGDTYLILLEKAMAQLALDRPDVALKLLRKSRDQLDGRYRAGLRQFFAAVLSDDRALDYTGADYEHILVRVMLCLCDLLVNSSQTGGDAYAYALQIGEKQEEIVNSPLGEDVGYKPREEYRRLGVGAYLQGMILEATGAADGAARAYRRCTDYEPAFRLGKEALKRTESGRYAAQGEGVLHVFFLGGAGPIYVEGESPPTELALRIAQYIAAVLLESPVPLLQTNVPVPVHAIHVRGVPPIAVAAGTQQARTETLLDVNLVAAQQLDRMMPLIIARAVLRRAVKTAATTGASEAVKHKNRGRKGEWAELGFAVANLLWTAAERADTRIWTALPAQIQVARLPLAEGTHTVRFGQGVQRRVRIRAARDSYAVVIRPNLGRPGALVIDRLSRAADEGLAP